MQIRRQSIITLGLMVFTTMATAVNSSTASAEEGHKVAVIDVAYIFKNNEAIKGQVSSVEESLKNFETEMKTKRAELQQEAAKLKTFSVGSPDYENQSQKVALLESKLRTDMARKRKELADAEAAIYYKNYKLIAEAVGKIAEANNIAVVFRYNSEDMNLEKGESVIRGVMKNIVYHDSRLDMTEPVNSYLSKVLVAQGAASRR
ncbi:MAG: OmpH family outer membrane protein [Planctomycetota bacterium]